MANNGGALMKVAINALIGTIWIGFWSTIVGFLVSGVLWGSMDLGPVVGILGFLIGAGIPFFFLMRNMLRSIAKYQAEQRMRTYY